MRGQSQLLLNSQISVADPVMASPPTPTIVAANNKFVETVNQWPFPGGHIFCTTLLRPLFTHLAHPH